MPGRIHSLHGVVFVCTAGGTLGTHILQVALLSQIKPLLFMEFGGDILNTNVLITLLKKKEKKASLPPGAAGTGNGMQGYPWVAPDTEHEVGREH